MGLFPEPQRRGLEGCLLLLANFKAGEASRRQYRRRPLLQSLPRQARIWRAELKEYGAAGNGGSYLQKPPFSSIPAVTSFFSICRCKIWIRNFLRSAPCDFGHGISAKLSTGA